MKKYFERDYQNLVVCSRNIYLEVKYIFKRTINCVPNVTKHFVPNVTKHFVPNVTKHFVPNVTKHSETLVVINKGKNNRAGFCFFLTRISVITL